MGSRALRLAALACLCSGMGAATALGAGPDPGVAQNARGIARGKVLYVALPAGDRTVVRAISRSSGRVLRHVAVNGRFGLPMVAFDGTVSGLSADGHTLVLGQERTSPYRSASSFTVLDVPRLKVRSVVKLRGDFSFDALSPNGKTLYLIEHVSKQNVARYRVRAYDLAAGELLSKMVTDKSRWQSVMVGIPQARATTKDQRWAFTLYVGGSHPFVHSLDTRKAYAVCIDLPQRWSTYDFGRVRLRMRGNDRLIVRYAHGRQLAVLDTKKFRVLSAVRTP